jgi:phosphoesterase, MJ0936 family
MSNKIKIILCSDNHRWAEPLVYLQKEYPDADYFLHCGDSELPKNQMAGFACVQGNNDCYGEYPLNLILPIGDHRILLTHGHRDMMFGHYEMLAKKAKMHNCDVACCGHSHVPYAGIVEGVTCLNPGSIWHNRDGSAPSYMVVMFDGPDITWEKKVYKK